VPIKKYTKCNGERQKEVFGIFKQKLRFSNKGHTFLK
jgi:hypothetical protein